jgi:hypothetical protein
MNVVSARGFSGELPRGAQTQQHHLAHLGQQAHDGQDRVEGRGTHTTERHQVGKREQPPGANHHPVAHRDQCQSKANLLPALLGTALLARAIVVIVLVAATPRAAVVVVILVLVATALAPVLVLVAAASAAVIIVIILISA